MRQQFGYTLVELLVALALLAIMAVMMSGGVRFAGRARDVTDQKSGEQTRMLTAQNLMRSILSHALPPTRASAATEIIFIGKNDRVKFSSDPNGATGLRGIQTFELSLSTTNQGSRVQLAWRGRNPFGPGTQHDLFSSPAKLVLSYGEIGTDDQLRWQEIWDNPEQLPKLIRISAKSNFEYWPELIIATRIGESPDCLFDPVSFSCRPR